MITRRNLLIGMCCALHSGPGKSAEAELGFRFVCSTIDTVPNDGFMIVPLGAGKTNDFKTQQKAIKAFNMTPYGVGFLTDRWRLSDGLTPKSGKITLGVFVFETQRKALIQNAAQQWLTDDLGAKIAFDFDVPVEKSHIRIACERGQGNNSEVGRKSLTKKQSEPTMYLDDVVDHVIIHEFGHALGLQHEHQSPDPKNPIVWKDGGQVVIDEMRKKQGWSVNETKRNILDKFPKGAACVGDPKFNINSIMIYPIPSNWTENGFSVGQNNMINVRDRNCLKGIYNA
jgi:hypothetical protein